MNKRSSSPSIREIDFQLSRRPERPELTVSPWTDLVFDGERLFVRSRRRPSLLAAAPSASAAPRSRPRQTARAPET